MLKRLLAWIFAIILVGAVLVALLPGSTGSHGGLDNYTWYTEEYPPYNYAKDGIPEGTSVDILRDVLAGMGVDPAGARIRVGPWTEGYQAVLHTPGTVIFSTARTPEREHLFKWAGPIFTSRNVLFALKEENVTVSSPGDLERLRIGAIRDDIAEADLVSMGISPDRFVVSSDARELVALLEAGEIDAWAYAELPGEAIIMANAGDPGKFEVVYSLGTWDYYFAFNREAPDRVVNEFQAGIDRLGFSRRDIAPG